MAKAGFAGSLIVQAGWRGKSMSKGMKKSSAELKKFSGQVRGLLALAGGIAVGVGAAFSLKGIIGLVKQTSAGSAAWSKWQIAIQKVKLAIADVLAGPAASILEWSAGMLEKAADFIPIVASVAKTVGSAMLPSLKSLAGFLTTIANVVLQKIVQSVQNLVALIRTVVNLAPIAFEGMQKSVSGLVGSIPFANQIAGGLL